MGRRNKKYFQERTGIDRQVRSLLEIAPPGFVVKSVKVLPVSPELTEIAVTGRVPLKAITVEGWCIPKPPKQEYSTVFSQPYAKKWRQPFVCLWLGFCNHQLRPLFQILLDGGQRLVQVYSDGLLEPEKPAHLAGTFDGKMVRLYVDAKVVGEKAATGVLAQPAEEIGSAIGARSPTDPGGHYDGALLYVRLWKSARTEAQLRDMMHVDPPPPDPDPKASNECSLSTIPDLAYLSHDPDCISWWSFAQVGLAGRPLLNEHDLATATRILKVAGISLSEQDGPVQTLVRAGTTLLDCCDALESLIDKPEIDEPQILGFFKQRPHATFLIEPDQEKAWREQRIQGYGQIDFVFQKTNGRYIAVEIEPPNEPLFLKNDEFSKRFDHAIDQVQQWSLGGLIPNCP
jgi:hypothetical protein